MYPDLSMTQDVLQILIVVFGFGTMFLQEYFTYKENLNGNPQANS